MTQAEKIAWFDDPARHKPGAPIYKGQELLDRIPKTRPMRYVGTNITFNEFIPAEEID